MVAATMTDAEREALKLAAQAIDAGRALEAVVRPIVESRLPARVSLEAIMHRGGPTVEAYCKGIDTMDIMAEIAKEFDTKLRFERGYVTTDVWIEAMLPSHVYVRIEGIFLSDEVRAFRKAQES
jgi:hypothetical protein